MDPDLMHPPSLGAAEHHAGVGTLVVAKPLEHGGAVLALRGDLAHADLVAHHFNWLLAFDLFTVIKKNLYLRVLSKMYDLTDDSAMAIGRQV